MDFYMWTSTGMSRQHNKGGGPMRYVREADLQRIILLIEDNAPRTTYANEEDDVGAFGCCDEVTYKGHAKDCWWEELKRLVKR